MGQDYDEFVDKFKPKLTTDDCYTPNAVYDAVSDWVSGEYGIDRAKFVRPFWPGADYTKHDYAPDCVVVDNPPFSIYSQIVRWYTTHDIRFFIFAPHLTMFQAKAAVCYIPVGVTVIYANDARVNTSFVTNLDNKLMRSAPELYKTVKRANAISVQHDKKQLQKYDYDDHIITSSMVNVYSKRGIEFAVYPCDAQFIGALDAQRKAKKAIFGGGLLLSDKAAADKAAADKAAADKAAADKAAADKAAAIKWELSEREIEIVRAMAN